MNEKPKYVKPIAMDIGSLKPVHGAQCASGSGATDFCASTGYSATLGCGNGNDPDLIPYCETNGNIATGNCIKIGNSAGQTCRQVGASPDWGWPDKSSMSIRMP